MRAIELCLGVWLLLSVGCGEECVLAPELGVASREGGYVLDLTVLEDPISWGFSVDGTDGHSFQSGPGASQTASNINGFVISQPHTLTVEGQLKTFADALAECAESLEIESPPTNAATRTAVLAVDPARSLPSVSGCALGEIMRGAPTRVPPPTNPVYGSIICPGSSQCYSEVSVVFTALRSDTRIVTVLALTPGRPEDGNDATDRIARMATLADVESISLGSPCGG